MVVIGSIGERTMAGVASNGKEIGDMAKALSSENVYVRLEAVEALGESRDQKAVTLLQQALKDEEFEVRESAYAMLRKIGTPAIPHLVSAMNDESFYVRMYASLAIADHILENPSREYSEDVIDALTRALLDKSIYVRRSAYDALKVIEYNKVIKSLINALDSNDYGIRVEAIVALGKIADRRAVKALMRSMRIHDTTIRRCAAHALGRIGDKRAVSALVPALEDTEGSVRREVIRALGAIGDEKAAMYLLCALKDQEPVVREEAANALGHLRPLRSIEPFLQAIDSESAYVRREAVKALGHMRKYKAIEPLVRALGDHDAGVRESACDALASMGTRAISYLNVAMDGSDVRARNEAAKALDRINCSIALKRTNNTMNEVSQPRIKSVIEAESPFIGLQKAGQASLSSFNI